MSGGDEARLPPHHDEAEQGVLGGMLLDNYAWDRVDDLLLAEHFYRPEHRAIYSTIQSLIMATKPADVLTVHERGGHDLAYLNSLAASVPSARNVRRYAEIVRSRWVARQLMRIGADLADEALGLPSDDTPVLGLVDKTITALMALTQNATPEEPRHISSLVPRFIDELSAKAEGESDAIPTGLVDLDRLTGGGGRPGELWVIGARPSMGKSALTLNIARHVGALGGVLTLTQEDSQEMLVARHVAAAGKVNLAHLRTPPAGRPEADEMWSGVSYGADVLTRLDILIDDKAGLTLADVRRKIQQAKRQLPALKLVIVDYLQLMTGDGDNRNQQLGQIANGLKTCAKDYRVWIVLLSQLNRKADERSGGPQVSDLRDSGDIEGAADLIGLLYRESQRHLTDENRYYAEINVAKQKNGATDTVSLHFDGMYQRFGNWDGPRPRRSARAAASSSDGYA